MIELHPEIVDGKKQFVILPYENLWRLSKRWPD